MQTAAAFMPAFFAELQRDGQVDRAMAVARGAVAGVAIWQYFEAQRQAERAYIDRLVSQASEARERYPQRAVLLAAEALQRSQRAGVPTRSLPLGRTAATG